MAAIRQTRRAAAVIIAAICLAMAPARISAALFSDVPAETPRPAPIAVALQAVERSYRDIPLAGTRPVVTGGAAGARAELNRRLDAQYNAFLKGHAAADVKRLTFETKTFTGEYKMSVLFTCTIEAAARTERYAATLTFDEDGRALTLADAADVNLLRLVNHSLAAEVAAEPKLYNPSFRGIADGHDFYVDGGALVIPFGAYELLAAPGLTERVFNYSDFMAAGLGRESYYTKADYGVRMVPLRVVAEAFGLQLTWDGETGAVTVLRGKTALAALRIGQNLYTADTGRGRALEAAPELKDGWTYVPLSFCEEYLTVYATIEPSGYIILTGYMGE